MTSFLFRSQSVANLAKGVAKTKAFFRPALGTVVVDVKFHYGDGLVRVVLKSGYFRQWNLRHNA